MEIGDIVKPTREWYEDNVIGRIRATHPYDVFLVTSESLSERIKQAEDYYERCFGIIINGKDAFSVKWLNKGPNLLIKCAWWERDELELVEKRHPYWEKYLVKEANT